MLIGNTYPASLIRRDTLFRPISLNDAQQFVRIAQEIGEGPISYWGHSNTVALASGMLGVDLTPREERPTITLDNEAFPTLYGKAHQMVLVVSADIRPDHIKPRSDKSEYKPEDIAGWRYLLVTFPEYE